MKTTSRQLDQLEAAIVPDERPPLLVLFGDPYRERPGYWRGVPEGPPLTRQEIEELAKQYQTVFFCNYGKDEIHEDERKNH